MSTSIDARVTFHPDDRTMEIDLTDLALEGPEAVGSLYDMLERQAAATGEKWFFLINYLNCRIYPEAWVAFSNRGKKFNLAFSLGTVRYNTEEDTNAEILRRASEEQFDANLVTNRNSALAKLASMRVDYFKKHPQPKPVGQTLNAEFDRRVKFDRDARVMEVDFSDFSFTDSHIVNAFYDAIARRITQTGQAKWFFLVNYHSCVVYPEAWLAHANRGKRMNTAHSLGTARYAASDSATSSIQMRAGTETFAPNLFSTREQALLKIKEMQRPRSDAPANE